MSFFHLFNAFIQADLSTTRKYGGTGLGLTITKQLCEIMGGGIRVKSKIGVGSEFLFEVAFRHPQNKILNSTTISEKTDIQADTLDRLENKRFLLVEDNKVNQMVVQGNFKKRGLTIDVVENGLIALQKLQEMAEETAYDLIFMDCQMPEMDGYEATQRIRHGEAGNAYKTIPIIAMTANAMKGDREKCLECGMNDYISKPINPKEIDRIFEEWLTENS